MDKDKMDSRQQMSGMPWGDGCPIDHIGNDIFILSSPQIVSGDPSPAQEDRPSEGFGESSGVRPRPELWQIRFDNSTA